MSYNPSEYWSERGKTYQKKFKYDKNKVLQEEFLLDYLYSISEPFSSVLELGCGFGRVTKILLNKFDNIKNYLAVDMSKHQIENARNYVGSLKMKEVRLDFLVSDILSLEQSKKYDLVILSEVLMHILPSEIDSVIKKLISLTNKHIINIDWYEDRPPNRIAPHNFIHEYKLLYTKNPEISEVQRIPIKRKKLFHNIDTRQSIFHATTLSTFIDEQKTT